MLLRMILIMMIDMIGFKLIVQARGAIIAMLSVMLLFFWLFLLVVGG